LVEYEELRYSSLSNLILYLSKLRYSSLSNLILYLSKLRYSSFSNLILYLRLSMRLLREEYLSFDR
jgi:hypothetical protein